MIDFSPYFFYNVYVKSIFEQNMADKVGRNDPCPCGSGKKYKKCCELKKMSKNFTAHPIGQEEIIAKKTESKAKSLFNNFFKSPEKNPPDEEKPQNKE